MYQLSRDLYSDHKFQHSEYWIGVLILHGNKSFTTTFVAVPYTHIIYVTYYNSKCYSITNIWCRDYLPSLIMRRSIFEVCGVPLSGLPFASKSIAGYTII